MVRETHTHIFDTYVTYSTPGGGRRRIEHMSYLSHGAGDTYVTYSTHMLQIRHLEGVVGVEVGVGDEGFKETGIDIVVVIGKLLPQNALPCWLEKCGQDLVARACNVCVCVCVCVCVRARMF